MSEAPDAGSDDFDAEFEAARTAEIDDAAGAPEGGADGEAGGEEGKQPAPQLDADKAVKRLRETQRALKSERLERQKLTARLEALERGGSTAKAAPRTAAELAAALREDDDDPIGQIQTLTQLAKQLVGQTESERQADSQAQERNRALTTVSSTMKDYEDDFRELNPDYDKAAKLFMDARAEELRDTGLTGQDLVTAMQNDFAGIVSRSVAAGKDPAEIIYNMAVRRGFKLDNAAAKLQTVERGQAHARTLAGGGSPQGALTPGKVADLKGAAFDAAFEKLRASERRR